MGNEQGRKALDAAAGAWKQAQPSLGGNVGAGPAVSADKDSELQEGWHNRSFNPIDSAPRRSVSSELNADSARYKKGPGPV